MQGPVGARWSDHYRAVTRPGTVTRPGLAANRVVEHGHTLATAVTDGVRLCRGAGAPRRGRAADCGAAAGWPAYRRGPGRSHEQPCGALYRVLRFLAGEGVFQEQSPGLFANTELSDALRADAPASPRDFIRMINREAYAAWGQLLHSVRTGRDRLRARLRRATLRMAGEPSRGGGTVPAGDGVVEPGWQHRGRPCLRFFGLPAGCRRRRRARPAAVGDRQLANPHLTGVLLDLPAGIEAARNGVGGPLPRCELVAGDFFDERSGGRHLRHQEGHPRLG